MESPDHLHIREGCITSQFQEYSYQVRLTLSGLMRERGQVEVGVPSEEDDDLHSLKIYI